MRRALARLLPLGWQSVFARHGLAIPLASDEQGFWDALTAELPVDRGAPGFGDFAGIRAVEPGDPARSLIFHALAHPAVHPTRRSPDRYPTPAELDAVEDAIWDAGPAPTAGALAVLAYAYRPASRTGHGQHADFVFSRTGIARVGTVAAAWDPVHRCFAHAPGPAALPSRFAVFEVEWVRADAVSAVGRPDPDDGARLFVRPIRKITGEVAFAQAHRSERLARLVDIGGVQLAQGFDAQAAPMVRSTGLVRLEAAGSSAWLHSLPAPLVRLARQHNALTGRDEVARFVVPPRRGPLGWLADGPNRRYTSLRLPQHFFTDIADALMPMGSVRDATTAYSAPRGCPTYVNIRHRVVADPLGGEPLVEFLDASTPDLEAVIDAGGYEAALFVDQVCEGCVSAHVDGRAALPALSLVCAPDFFPHADGIDLAGDELQEHFLNGNPAPLCEGRLLANPTLLQPDGTRAFGTWPGPDTVAAAISRPPVREDLDAEALSDRTSRATNHLPDAASGVFAPGWDVTYDSNGAGLFYSTDGLGSPFLEDVKLCAAANGMWPAASPDAARTFQGALKWTFETPTAIPLLDAELGWDGVPGPYFEQHDGAVHVNFADIGRADYVAAARAGQLSADRLAHLDSHELIRRMDALRLCIHSLPGGAVDPRVSRTDLWLVVARPKPADPGVYDHFQPPSALGYLFAFARTDAAHELVAPDSDRRRQRCGAVYTCIVSPTDLHWTQDGVSWHQVQA